MELTKLVGKTIKNIYFNKNNLRFVTDEGSFTFEVEGGCCSHSEFWDFFGVENLLKNGLVKGVDSVELEGFPSKPEGDDDLTQYYGYKIISESPTWGEQTSVFSFRNMSNGYYGGWMSETEDKEVSPEITNDVLEAQE